jgi:hypothetical protein
LGKATRKANHCDRCRFLDPPDKEKATTHEQNRPNTTFTHHSIYDGSHFQTRDAPSDVKEIWMTGTLADYRNGANFTSITWHTACTAPQALHPGAVNSTDRCATTTSPKQNNAVFENMTFSSQTVNTTHEKSI